MPLHQMPAVDQNVCSAWSEIERDRYEHLDYYLAEKQVKRRKKRVTWAKMLGTYPWTPNEGETIKMVRKEPTPMIRQEAFPAALSAAARMDIVDVHETSVSSELHHHKFQTPAFHFYPSFRDFFKNHVEVHSDNIMAQMERFEDVFYRSHIFHQSPYVYLAGADDPLVAAPMGNGNITGTDGKTTAWLAANLPLIKSGLNFETIDNLINIVGTDFGVPPYSGEQGEGLGSGLTERWVFVTSAEGFGQFKFDPWFLQNKATNLNITTDVFKGDILGQVTCKCEQHPYRHTIAGAMHAPETRVLQGYNKGETIPNGNYTDIDTSPFEVGFFIGGESGYDILKPGAPPKAFTSGAEPDNFMKLRWNGEIFLTKNFLVPCVNDDGTEIQDTNDYGEYVKYRAHATYGIIGYQRRNILPVIYKRRRGAPVV